MSDDLKINFAATKTKLAAVRTLIFFIVTIKAFILLCAKKHLKFAITVSIILIITCGYHYHIIIDSVNKGKIIENNLLLDYYPLMLIPILFVLTYMNFK